MKIIKVLLVSFSLFLIHQIQACGGGYYYSDYFNIYQISRVLPNGTLGLTYHNSKTEFKGDAVDDNLKEWEIFFRMKYSKEHLEGLIYTDLSYFDKERAKKVLKKSLPFEVDAFIEYMDFAKKCELIATANNDPWRYEKLEKDFAAINNLIKQAKLLAKNATTLFYKERYTFQLLKLLYYGEKYSEATTVYNNFYDSNSSKSIMQFWGLNYLAGAQMQMGDTLNANYNFLKSFHSYSGGRYNAYQSMIFSNEKQFSNTLSLCKNNAEKAAFYFVRGANRKSVVLEDLKNVLQLAPNSEYAEILMANEIVNIEHIYWEVNKNSEYNSFDWVEDVQKIPSEQLMKYIQEFILLAKKSSETLNNKNFWNISLAYLYTLNKEFQKSENALATIKTDDEKIAKQIEANHLLNYVLLNSSLNVAKENELGSMWLAYNNGVANANDDIFDYGDKSMRSINNLLMSLLNNYYQNKNELKALLFSGSTLYDYKDEYNENMEIENIQKVRTQLKNTSKTKLLEYGMSVFLQSNINQNEFDNALKEIEATLYMRNPNTLKEAIALFKELPETARLKTNPFNMEIRDCIWGGWGDDEGCNHKLTNYTKLSFATKLLEVKYIAEIKNSAMDYYLLGNAYYNMTYYGPTWETLSYYRSGWKSTGFADCSIALEFYEKAIELFKNDKEMRAKAIFMAAKCQQNIYFEKMQAKDNYVNLDFGYRDKNQVKQFIKEHNSEVEAAGLRTHFKTLANDYKDTKFYSEIIKECSYFDAYVSR